MTEPHHHADHDLERVAGLAARDLPGDELDAVTHRTAACPDCAALLADLRVLAAATHDLPAPARPRDFRLGADDAARLHGSTWPARSERRSRRSGSRGSS
jgi:hypothetical protein